MAGYTRSFPASPTPESFSRIVQASRRIVVLGDPRAGKTTLLRWLALVAAAGRHATREALIVNERLMPLALSVGRLAELHLQHTDSSFTALAVQYFQGLECGDLRPAIEEILNSPQGLLLLDGLDEVPDVRHRLTIARLLEHVSAQYPTRIVISSRAMGFPGLNLGASTSQVVLEPLDRSQSVALARSFYKALHWSLSRDEDWATSQAATESEALVGALESRKDLAHFQTNPLLLTLAALVHSQLGRLPRYRARLYQIASQTLVESWAETRRFVAGTKPPAVVDYETEGLRILPSIALRMHDAGGQLSKRDLLSEVAKRIPGTSGLTRDQRGDLAKCFLDKLEHAGQLLVDRGGDRWAFVHPTFREYLCAKQFATTDTYTSRATPSAGLYDPWWQEVWRLLAGELGVVQERPAAASKWIDYIHRERLSLGGRIGKNLVLAVKCLVDTGCLRRAS